MRRFACGLSLPLKRAALVAALMGAFLVPEGRAGAPKPVPPGGPPARIFIEELRNESFKGKGIRIVKAVERKRGFTRYLIDYDSRGLRVSGMMNVPAGEGPFPVVILNHGYYGPRPHAIGYGFREAADIFSENGYLAIGSDYRNNGLSEKGDNFFQHMGYLDDVLSLVEAVKDLPNADRDRIGMWGHSLGGLLTMKACIISGSVRVAALFDSMSADDRDFYAFLWKIHPEALTAVTAAIGTPRGNPQAFSRMSALTHLELMPRYVIVHQGEKDQTTPPAWSEKLVEALRRCDKTVEYHSYPGQGHILSGGAWETSMSRTVAFFDRRLKAADAASREGGGRRP